MWLSETEQKNNTINGSLYHTWFSDYGFRVCRNKSSIMDENSSSQADAFGRCIGVLQCTNMGLPEINIFVGLPVSSMALSHDL